MSLAYNYRIQPKKYSYEVVIFDESGYEIGSITRTFNSKEEAVEAYIEEFWYSPEQAEKMVKEID